ncbi:MAG TPA: MFS transporter [Ktedonobacteraceae bacterium]
MDIHTETTTPVAKPGWLISRNFALLWIGQTISAFGSRITREGLPLTANLVLRATPGEMGLLAAAGTLPVLLIGLLAGVWVDRLRRRPILIIADISRAVLLGTVPVAAALGVLHIEQLYVVAVLVGALTVFFEVANQSFLPTLVQREHIVEGNSKLSTSESLAEIGGPALAGVLVQAITAPVAILFDAISFLASALCAGFIRVHEPAPSPTGERQSLWREMREGLRLVLGNPLLRATTAALSVRAFFGGAFATLYGLYVIRQLGVTPAIYGLLVTMGGLGALAGALLAGRIVSRFGLGRTLIGAMLLSGGVSVLTPLAGGPKLLVVALLMTAQLVGDFGMEVYLIHAVSLRQSMIPDRFLGRANASANFLVGGMLTIGALLAGLVGGMIGMRLTLLIATIAGLLIASGLLLFSPVRRK